MRDFAMDIPPRLAAAGVLFFSVVHLDLWQQGLTAAALLGQTMRERIT